MTDHREDIRHAAESHTQAARFAYLAEVDELPHAFDPDDDDPDICTELGCMADADDETAHGPEGFDPDEYVDGLSGFLLDADTLNGDDADRWRVELLLTCGGPTVSVVVDSRWSTVEYHHSWGRGRFCQNCGGEEGTPCGDGGADDHVMPDRTMIELSGDDAATWQDVARYAAGVGE